MAAPIFALLLLAAETRALPPGSASPPARIADIAWLAGTWAGPGIGGAMARESWTPPVAGQMSAHFEQLDAKGSIAFYELIQIVPEGRSLAYRLKHFDARLGGWEDKPADAAERFPLVAIERDAVHFDGLSYYRRGADAIRAVVRVGGDGRPGRELVFDLRRVRP